MATERRVEVSARLRGALVLLAALLAAVLLVGCGRPNYEQLVRQRHAAEVGCVSSGVTVSRIADRQYMAWGCDASGVYTCRRGGQCSLDGAITRGGFTQ